MERQARCRRMRSVPTRQANVNEAGRVSIHEAPLKTASGQLPLLGLEIVSQAAQARGLPDDRRVVRHLTLALLTS